VLLYFPLSTLDSIFAAFQNSTTSYSPPVSTSDLKTLQYLNGGYFPPLMSLLRAIPSLTPFPFFVFLEFTSPFRNLLHDTLFLLVPPSSSVQHIHFISSPFPLLLSVMHCNPISCHHRSCRYSSAWPPSIFRPVSMTLRCNPPPQSLTASLSDRSVSFFPHHVQPRKQ